MVATLRTDRSLRWPIAVTVLMVTAWSCAGTEVPLATPASTGVPSVAASAAARPSVEEAPIQSTPIPIRDGEPWIAYAWPVGDDSDGHVGTRLIRPDGSGDHWASPDVPLPPEGWQIFQDWSPDGRRLVFTADDGGRDRDAWTRDLWISEIGRPDAVKVLDCVLPCQEYAWPAWSRDGRTIAFTTFDLVDGIADGSRLMALDVESGATRELASSHGAEYLGQPRWSPDGRSLVVGIDRFSDTSTSSVLTGTAIAVVDLDAEVPSPRRLTDRDAWATYPDWHPTRDLIVFSDRPWTALATGPSNLHTIRPDGNELTDLTAFTSPFQRAVQPTWTPDGEAIIFTKVQGSGFGEPTLAMIDADGTDPRPAVGDTYRSGTHARLRPTP